MTNRKPYEVIEHTADIGIRVKAKSLKQLFVNAGLAIFDIIAEKKPSFKAKQEKINIRQRGENIEELLVNWLNELLFLTATREVVFTGFRIKKIDAGLVEAVGTAATGKNYRINTEIKAATYHKLKVSKTKSGWQAEVILDV